MKNKQDQVFIRADLDRTSTGDTIWYRLPANLKEFLNLCRNKMGSECEAIILTKEDDDDSGDYHWNIGFIFPNNKKHGTSQN